MQFGIAVCQYISYFLFLFLIAYYVILNLQWYNYDPIRVITKHHKWHWHVYYCMIPIGCYFLLLPFYFGIVFYLYMYIIFLPFFVLWYKKLDKKLVWTARVKRYFFFVAVCCLFCVSIVTQNHYTTIVANSIQILPILLGMLCSILCEYILFKGYAKLAYTKLMNRQNLRIIAITGSYGKTSTKNFVAQILQQQFKVYATPRSVNTLKGLVSDININLDSDCQIYIAEAGARNRGDIAAISQLLQQHYGIIGKIGKAHIEYFKDIQTTIQTKFEMLHSKRLIKAFVQKDNEYPKDFSPIYTENLKKIIAYPPEIKYTESTLDGTKFCMYIDSAWIEFETSILGTFNIDNIAVAILLAKEFGMEISKIQKAVATLTPIPHRLQKILTPHKIILDDSFNGNLEGMSEAIRLSSLHNGRKVIVTPGLVESDEESNSTLAKYIDSVFDLVIITGDLNAKILDTYITKPKKILLKNKSDLESILATTGQQNDLVLFANDAPSYV